MNRMNDHKYNAADVGRLLLDSLVYDVNRLNNDDDAEPPCTQEEFRELEKEIKNEQLDVYCIYTNLQAGILQTFNYTAMRLSEELTQAVQSEIEIMKSCTAAERCLDYAVKSTPFVVTEHQRRLLSEKLKARKGETLCTVNELALHTIQYFAEHSYAAPEYLKVPLLAMCDIKVTDKAVIRHYAAAEDLGYYQLPDKTKVLSWYSEEGKQEKFWSGDRYNEIINALNSYESRAIRQRLLYEGTLAVQQQYIEATGKQITTKKAAQLYEELKAIYFESIYFPEHRLPTRDVDRLYTMPEHMAKWHYCARLPQWTTALTVFARHPESFTLAAATGEGEPNYEAVATEFPELWDAALQYIEENLNASDLIPSVVDYHLDIREDPNFTFTWQYLAYKNFLDYSGKIDVKAADLAMLYQDDTYKHYVIRNEIEHSGIAVIYNDAKTISESFNHPDRYNHPDIYNALPISIEKVYSGKLERISRRRRKHTIMRAFYYITAFNDLMDIMAEFVYTPSLKKLKIKEEWYAEHVERYNRAVYELYSSAVGNPKEITRKRILIKSLFCPIDIAATRPNKQAHNKVVKHLNKLRYNDLLTELANLDRLIEMLSEGRSEPPTNDGKAKAL